MRITIAHRFVPAARVRTLVRDAFRLHEVDGADVEVHIKRHAQPHDTDGKPLFSGRAYSNAPSMANVANGTEYLATLRLCDPDTDGFPFVWSHRDAKTAQTPKIRSWEEGLVYLAGHEARHLRQYQTGLPASEVDAEAGGLVALNAYRQQEALEEATCGCMTEDPGDGFGERVVTHSSRCMMHPEHDGESDGFHATDRHQ